MKTYKVVWTDICEREVEANSEEEAMDIANRLGSESTDYFQDACVEEI